MNGNTVLTESFSSYGDSIVVDRHGGTKVAVVADRGLQFILHHEELRRPTQGIDKNMPRVPIFFFYRSAGGDDDGYAYAIEVMKYNKSTNMYQNNSPNRLCNHARRRQ